MKILRLDFETFSEVPLTGKESVGTWNYTRHPSTRILMLGYKMPDANTIELWQPHLCSFPSRIPKPLLNVLKDPTVMISAFHSAFERGLLEAKLNVKVPINRFIDPQASARYLSMPGDLDEVSTILGLPVELAKDKRGKELIKFFCEPQIKKVKGQPSVEYVNDWKTHPKEWKEFCNYCKQDIVAEEEVSRRMTILGALPLPPLERQIWELDQKINDRGIFVDVEFTKKAHKLATRAKQEAKDRQNVITGLENANSTAQLLPWVQERGYPFSTLNKNTVDSVLKDPEVKLSEECRKVLTARREASSTSYTKLAAILRQVSDDNRLRGLFVYMGSPRCGRWSSNALQFHNQARPDKVFEELENVIAAREMIRGEKYDEIKARFGSVLLVVKNCVRTAFAVPEGFRFNVGDFNAIETRVGAWIASCKSLLDVFQPLPNKPNGRDPYLDFASKMYGIPYDVLEYDYENKKEPARKAEAKLKRQMAKPGLLGAIYRLSGGGWGYNKDGDKIRTGLWGYAWAMGIELTQEQAHMIVRIFREAYREIPEFWYLLENAVADVMRGQNTIRKVGPNGCIQIDKINIAGRHPMMRMQLPSGRYLHYLDARLESCKMPWQDKETGEDVYRDSLVYAGQNQETKQWDTVQTHGGKLFENLTQATARDLLGEGLIKTEGSGIEVCAHVHDEIIGLTLDDPFAPGKPEMEKLMSGSLAWAPGLLLGAEAWEGNFYHK